MPVLDSAEKVRRFLADSKWIENGRLVEVEPLPGGVSSHVWLVRSDPELYVLKQPLARLATEVEWRSGLGRSEREVACLNYLGGVLPGQVPRVVAHDAAVHAVLMTSAPEEALSWKDVLLSGTYHPREAKLAGAMLRSIHRESRSAEATVRPAFDDVTYFEELRIEPFHRFLIDRYPGLKPEIGRLIDRLLDGRTCLTHGDFSPKNILVTEDRMILLDYEVAHWGNPVFDVAYCIGHLMLKGWAFGRQFEAADLIGAFLDAYGLETDPLLPHLGLMLLARLDGKSPVDYVTDDILRARIRSVAQSWLGIESSGDPLAYICTALGVDDLE